MTVPVTVQAQHFARKKSMQMELLSHNKLTMIHSKHAKGVIANDKNDPSAAHCIVEGMDAIDDTIPLTIFQLATYLPPEPINAVEKMEDVIRHPEQVGHSSKSGRHYSNEILASIFAIFVECPSDYDAPLHTSPPELPSTKKKNKCCQRSV
eukprot:scaffold2754_cov125-Skeletonema_dohrnii-CCMP3373.AAC.2